MSDQSKGHVNTGGRMEIEIGRERVHFLQPVNVNTDLRFLLTTSVNLDLGELHPLEVFGLVGSGSPRSRLVFIAPRMPQT